MKIGKLKCLFGFHKYVTLKQEGYLLLGGKSKLELIECSICKSLDFKVSQ